MTINVERDFELVMLEITGRLDSTTAPNLEKTINNLPGDTKKIVFNISNLEYISSAGIRVLMNAYNKMKNGDGIKIVGTNDFVREVFEMTGLSELMV